MKPCSARKVKFIICSLTPFALLPLALSPHQEAKCAYIILWMAVYWVLEPVHLTMTALLPVVLMPMFGILSEAEVTSNYMKEEAYDESIPTHFPCCKSGSDAHSGLFLLQLLKSYGKETVPLQNGMY
ncbi:solute carrier family 13 member 3 [Trichonephila inaurata madagascariensis]|uniref:Solute carrier family 13 member 3 n=1 Tax=Trichonephila inaurata madagascariensis TaxID=2747483 RepID=A0A8X6IGM9_9ARAC|nr:solute carrier family 13 member 3 [Trichonephila inaurata madagascariensis]